MAALLIIDELLRSTTFAYKLQLQAELLRTPFDQKVKNYIRRHSFITSSTGIIICNIHMSITLNQFLAPRKGYEEKKSDCSMTETTDEPFAFGSVLLIISHS